MLNALAISKQRGQSMVLSLALMTFALMTVLYSYNTSKVNLESSKLQNTADNAAYSAATFIARDYNFKAYTNRASVANQVAIAQMVGLSSWFNMTDRFARNACNTLCWIPYVGNVINAIKNVVGPINRGVQQFVNVAVRVENVMLRGLSISQQIMHYAGAVSSIESTQDIVEANDPNSQLDLMQNPLMLQDVRHAWFTFQKRHSRTSRASRTQFNEFKQVTMASRDRFSSNRTYRLGSPWSGSIPFFKWKVIKAGGSDLISNGNRRAETWTSMDSISYHYKYWGCSWFRCRWRGYYEVPLGWGGTRSDTRANMNRVGNNRSWGASRSNNRSGSRLAARNQQRKGSYSGVQPFYGLSNSANRRSETDNISIVVSKEQNNLRTTSQINSQDTGVDPANDESLLGDRLSSLASAQAYYSRPRDLMMSTSAWARGDSRHEYGNLYNPFWQVRLAESTNSDRSVVYAITRFL
ncbi:Tad domain-containing protein [Shewanella maritima]|nr:Tad domain-containing protein [Shewanella maritima]